MIRIGELRLVSLVSALLTLSPQSAIAVDVVNGYDANWIDPRQETIFTSVHSPVKAELAVDSPVFNTSPDNSTGKLRIYLMSKQVFGQSIRKSHRWIKGPWIYLTDKHEPLVVVDIEPLDKPGVTNVGQTTFAYQYDSAKKRYKVIPSPESATDAAQAAGKVTALTRATMGDTIAELRWDSVNQENLNQTLKITKRRKTLLSGPLDTTGLSSHDRPAWSHPKCSGPYVSSLDGGSQPQVDLHYELVLNKGSGESTYYFERIYYYNNSSKKFKSLTHAWQENNPRLADLRHDGKQQFITEDWQLRHDAFNDQGGPLQIWELSKNHKLVNVTRQFPEEIRKHAKASMARYEDDKKNHGAADSDHRLLSYYADLCMLGERDKVHKELRNPKSPSSDALDKQILLQLKKHAYL